MFELVIMAVRICGYIVLALFASIQCLDENLRFASYYGDHMVLQRSPERAVLWGYGPESAQVTVSLSGPVNQKNSMANVTNGVWLVTLDPVEAGGPYNVTAAFPGGTATLMDVLFGDVWLCGGQSNMCFETSKIFNASEELALAAKYPQVRFFKVALKRSKTELTDLIQVGLPWSVPTASGLAPVSAVCWLFGRYMYEVLKYPIGLVQSCWGGTVVEAWSSSRALEQCGLELPNDTSNEVNSVLWNSMIHPLVNMTLKGAIWYQGESNAIYNRDNYSCSFPAMIDDWRMTFHQGSGEQTAKEFPFGFVQLSTYKKASIDDSFPRIRWHQTADIGFVPNPKMQRTFMAVAMDLPDETSPYDPIHPRDKQDVAYRLTLGARAVAYNEKNVTFLGPFPHQMLLTQTYINITYDQTISVTQSQDIFQICCSVSQAACEQQSSWVPAPIMHWGPITVQVSVSLCPHTDNVSGLRYAWKDWPCDFKACPIYSRNGALPAPPFLISRYSGNDRYWKLSQ
ncbi:sialate O-acetylesterase [Thalassophryne amazonica]|uniref:sialate O-acetylesterase n=1 Tax=Thalassophryne amazonica TaxID=390379 RepID=UPI001471082B|nr:sialate O-acetylesterase [Thalassophryne amazonica]